MKTVYIGHRITTDEDTSAEFKGQITFFFEDVTMWHEGAANLFKHYPTCTLVNLKEQGNIYISESYDQFTKKMTKFLHNQKNEIIFKNN